MDQKKRHPKTQTQSVLLVRPSLFLAPLTSRSEPHRPFRERRAPRSSEDGMEQGRVLEWREQGSGT